MKDPDTGTLFNTGSGKKKNGPDTQPWPVTTV